MNDADLVAESPVFGMWVDREDMQDGASWIHKKHEKWHRWRGELAGSDALTEHLVEHADEVSKDHAD